MTTLILPGDDLPISGQGEEVVIGPGIYSKPIANEIIPATAGILSCNINSTKEIIHIESNSKRYIPSVGDFVLGIVTGTYGESFRVSLSNFSSAVTLNSMAFPNATKKNRPNLKVGSLVYARVSHAEREIDVEIECLDPTTGKDGGFGLLEGGYIFDVTLAFARTLLFEPNHELLALLVKRCKFEIAIGLNGKIWVSTEDLKYTLALAKSIEKAQYVRPSEFGKVINTAFKDLGL